MTKPSGEHKSQKKKNREIIKIEFYKFNRLFWLLSSFS